MKGTKHKEEQLSFALKQAGTGMLTLRDLLLFGASPNPRSSTEMGLGLQPPLYLLAVQNAVTAARLEAVTANLTFIWQIGSATGGVVSGALFASILGRGAGAYLAVTVRVYQGSAVLALCFTLCLPDGLLRKRQRRDRAA